MPQPLSEAPRASSCGLTVAAFWVNNDPSCFTLLQAFVFVSEFPERDGKEEDDLNRNFANVDLLEVLSAVFYQGERSGQSCRRAHVR